MNGDFDPDQYDKQMAAAFGDDYYEVESKLIEFVVAVAAYLAMTISMCKGRKGALCGCKATSGYSATQLG